MEELLAVAHGKKPADFVIKNARIANVYTLEYEFIDIAIYGNKIVGVGKNYEGKDIINGRGKVLIPGMIDGHVHIESSMLAPHVFAEHVVSHGTTAIMADPHEIANVLGMKGIEYMFTASQDLPIDVFLGAPSCVPASKFESPFEKLGMMRIHEMFERGWCDHLAEAMDFPGVINGDDSVWGKLLAAGDVPLVGHAPGVKGHELCAYILGGLSSDHECTEVSEALEKLRRGMWVMMRAGSSAPNLSCLVQIVKQNPALSSRCMAVSDDVTAKDLVYKGHMDAKIKIMIQEGLDPLIALRMVTLSPADYFRLKDRGAIAPGLLADMVLIDSLENFNVDKVWKNGILVVDNGKTIKKNHEKNHVLPSHNTNVPGVAGYLSQEHLKVSAINNNINNANLCVIGVDEGSIFTRTMWMQPTVKNDYVVPDANRDIAKIVVQERHRGTGRFAVGFVSGMGMTQGAIASSVAHDAHNFISVGMDDQSIATALAHLGQNGGGLVVTFGTKVLGYFALPVAGLMTTLDAISTARALDQMEERAAEFGVGITNPFMTLSFLSLTVVPELKITDRGYVDMSKGGIRPLFENKI